MLEFNRILVSKDDLDLATVLQAGQAFRWVLDEETGLYITSMMITGNDYYSVVILRQSDDEFIEYTTLDNKCDKDVLKEHLFKYFRLEVNLNEIYQREWVIKDSKFKDISMHGLRVLSQEPWETLISFICSSNNNISRITKMCHALCSSYGQEIGAYGTTKFYSFPTSDQLVQNATEEQLRNLGFGYRAKYIIETAKRIVENKSLKKLTTDTEFLNDIRITNDYEAVREHLMTYTGVGPKVADCVCLMGMAMDHVVPVDVHVARIADRDYRIKSTAKDITRLRGKYSNLPITKKKINLELDHIRLRLFEKWGTYAGWAQSVLFFKEVGGTSGANTDGKIKKRKHIKLETSEEIKTELVTDIPLSKIPKLKTE